MVSGPFVGRRRVRANPPQLHNQSCGVAHTRVSSFSYAIAQMTSTWARWVQVEPFENRNVQLVPKGREALTCTSPESTT
jgi:hypothetical protein